MKTNIFNAGGEKGAMHHAGGEKGILMPDAASLFADYAAPYGIAVTAEQEEQFRIYARLLTERNKKVNLTAITDPEGIAAKHFLDSALLLKVFSPARGESVLDVGTGAGFPGVPLKILRSDLRLTLLDSLNKRLVFLDALLKELGISAELVHARAEEAGRQGRYRGGFGFVAARAVAAMPVLCEYCLPFLKPNGVFAAMKGRVSPEEDGGAKKAVSVLGCRIERVENYALPAGDARCVYLIRRVGTVPDEYPRHGSKIAKQPLG